MQCFLRVLRSLHPEHLPIRSAVYAQSARVTDWLTDAGVIDRNRPHLMYSMQPDVLTSFGRPIKCRVGR